jgi:tetratricopeptide (TPR) repeat protein
MDPEVLRRIFVQREKLLERVVDRLSRSMKTGDKHHTLLVGPRGSGKTALVSLAIWELQKMQELADCMRIAWLGEDDSFTSLLHLAFGIANQLSQEYPSEFPADFKTPVRGLPQDDAALSVLNSIVEQLGERNLILATENMDQTFRSLGDSGQKKWRAFLQETRKIATLATAQQLFAGVSDRKEAFFGFFDIHHMQPLLVDEASELIARIGKEQDKPELISYLNSIEGRYRIRALHYLAGGNHRMYVLLAEFLSKESLQDLVAAFESLAEDMTPYFQERVRSLPDQQRQLVQCLCDAEGALTVKQIAAETFIEERSCSKQLGNLKGKGYVRSEKRGKESYYDMAEPLMRLCLEVKNQRGRALKMVARFLRAWFPIHALKAGATDINSGRVGDYCALALESGGSFQSVIAEDLVLQIERSLESGSVSEAKALLGELRFADVEKAESLSTRMYAGDGIFGRSIESLTDIIELANTSVAQKAKSLIDRGVAYGQQGAIDLELSDYSSAIEMDGAPEDLKTKALFYRGVTYGQQGDIALELADYTSLIALDGAPVDLKAKALFNRGAAYGLQGDINLALSDYTAIIDLDGAPVDVKAQALFKRGFMYGQQNDIDLELSDYSSVIELNDVPISLKTRAIYNRGVRYHQKGDTVQALADYSVVVDLDHAPADPKFKALINRGAIYGQQGDMDLCFADYSSVIELDDAPVKWKAQAQANRGVQYWRNSQFEQSVSDFKAVLVMPSISSEQRTRALFAVVEPMVALSSREECVNTLIEAFASGDPKADGYGGTPHDLLWMVLRGSPAEWPSYISDIASLYIQHGVAEKLGQGITQSIRHLNEGGFSESQINAWNSAWQEAGKECDDLKIPLQCLDVAVEVMNSDPPTDRPLFRLPLEIRGLIRPLLNRSLGETEQ